ncbi:MAG: hypothetical protein IJE08_01040 [Clostridia bacterium]|nr:hypothetical protein [Clostridia bacterium]
MPYVRLNVSRPLTAEQIEAAREAIASVMSALPGKTRDNTMIHIAGSCALTMGDSGEPCMFLEARLYKPAPVENKQDFVKKISSALCSLFDIAPNRLYINIIELNEWGVGERFF